MKLRILGCSGGIGAGLRTTSLLIDDDILIDAGSGVGDLSHEEMSRIRHIFLTHSHLDHVAFIPLLVDSIFERIQKPIMVHALPETIEALRTHIFNWTIWPDFSVLPTPDKGVLAFTEMHAGDVVVIKGRQIELIPVAHIVPAAGYRVQSRSGSFAFSGDTSTNDSLWDVLNAHPALDLLIVETAFTNREKKLAALAKHYCPSSLAADLAKLKHKPKVYLTHLKPGEEMAVLSEVKVAIQYLQIKNLTGGEVFDI